MTVTLTAETQIEGLEQLDRLNELLAQPAENTESHERKLEDLSMAVLELCAARTSLDRLINSILYPRHAARRQAAGLRLKALELAGVDDDINQNEARMLLIDANKADDFSERANKRILELEQTRSRVVEALDQLDTHTRKVQMGLHSLTLKLVATCAKGRKALGAGSKCVRAPLTKRGPLASGSVTDDISVSRAEADLALLRQQIAQGS